MSKNTNIADLINYISVDGSGNVVLTTGGQVATQSYVTTAVSNLVNSAPSTLDTLNELAAALGNDANFATTVTNSIATKLPLSGGTLTGALNGTSATFSNTVTAAILNLGSTYGLPKIYLYDDGTYVNGIGIYANEYRNFFDTIDDTRSRMTWGKQTRAGSFTEFIRLTKDGFLGIGTDSPSEPLSVSFSAHGLISQHRKSSSIGTGQNFYMKFNDAGGTAVNYAGIYSDIQANTTGSHSGRMILQVANAGSLLSAVTIANTGVTTFVSTIAATGATFTTNSNSVVDFLNLYNNSATSAGGRITFGNGYGYIGAIKVSQRDNGSLADDGQIELQVASNAVLDTKVTILNNGNMGVGNTSPLQALGRTLTVEGTGIFQSTAGGGNYNENLRLNRTGNNYSAIAMGGAYGSTSGSGVGVWTLAATPSGSSYRFDFDYNGGTRLSFRTDGQIQQGGVGIVQIVPIGPNKWNIPYSGSINAQYTIGNTGIPSNARWLLADVFITANISDHQNFMLTRQNFGTQKTWVDTRGNNPDNEFGNLTQDDVTILTYNGEADGYTPNYGIWKSSVLIPSVGRDIWINNYGNSASSGYILFIVRGYSL